MHHEEKISAGTAKCRALEPYGATLGTYDDNTLLNLIIYEVYFPDGQVKEYVENIISDNIITQVESNVFITTSMEAILNHQNHEAT